MDVRHFLHFGAKTEVLFMKRLEKNKPNSVDNTIELGFFYINYQVLTPSVF
jgi:hypothetical protein